MQMRIETGKATLLTRKGLDWSERFPEIVASGGCVTPVAGVIRSGRSMPYPATRCRLGFRRSSLGGPSCNPAVEHALRDMARLPVREVISATDYVKQLTLGLGEVVFDYLKNA